MNIRNFIAIISFIGINFLITKSVIAIVDPLSVPNNKYGIHISNISDIRFAKELVNSNGGEWGYVTIVIREDERNLENWQKTFDELRQAKLIPIVRLATRYENGNWIKPRIEDLDPWVKFLDQLNWVTQNRYVILFNEPNHSKEWGGKINPEEYAQIYRRYQASLKAASKDFFVLPAGLDVAPENTLETMNPGEFYLKMYQADPQIFELYDGLTSHAYPHPDFSGSLTNIGRWSIRSYLWEIDEISTKGYDKNKPIFITETGWARSAIKGTHTGISDNLISQNLKTAFNQIWQDSRIVAVTPFILNYDQAPFAQFSWIDPITKKPTIFYKEIQAQTKLAGKPVQVNSAQISKPYYPSDLQPNSSYLIAVRFENTGQVIWTETNTTLKLIDPETKLAKIDIEPFSLTQPNQEAKVWIHIDTWENPGKFMVKLQLESESQTISEPLEFEINIAPPNYIDKLKVWIQSLLYQDFDQV